MAKESSKENLGITVTREKDFSQWYIEVVAKAELADYTAVSGCMVLRPYSYAIWEKIVHELDSRFKKSGIKNCYFPLFIPESLLIKEEEHVKGFSPEVAWVTKGGNSELSERLAIRPTSETIMYDSFSKWIRSWRDLPLLLNQWCSVVRWEFKNPKPFLRTREFLWQEGHTVHEGLDGADSQTMIILQIYKDVLTQYLAIPVMEGRKSEAEKFAGALYTTALEAVMPDGKALQMCTSHNLGQNFSKAFGIKFLGRDSEEHFAWQTSWGLSTRTIGAIIMLHGDDKGLVLPPKIAPTQVVIVPIFFDKEKEKILEKCNQLHSLLKNHHSVHLDDRDGYSPGWKFNEWELKGVPLRIELGPKDLEKDQVVIVRRDTFAKSIVPISSIEKTVTGLLDNMQKGLFDDAQRKLDSFIKGCESIEQLARAIEAGKVAKSFFCGLPACETKIKDASGGANSRVIPFEQRKSGHCISCGGNGVEAFFAKSY